MMQIMTPQQSGLPFDPINPMVQMYTYENNPPYVPRNHKLPQDVAVFLPEASAAVATAGTIRARESPPRMFLFNQLSANGYCNADFESVVVSVVELMCLRKIENTVNDIRAALPEAVDTVMQAKCVTNMFNHQELMNITAQFLGNKFSIESFYAFMNDFNNTAARVEQMKQRMFQPQMSQQNYPMNQMPQGGGYNQYNQNNQFSNPQNNQYSRFQAPQTQFPQQNFNRPQTGSGSLFTGSQPIQRDEQQHAHQHVDIAGKYSHLVRNNQQQNTPQQTNTFSPAPAVQQTNQQMFQPAPQAEVSPVVPADKSTPELSEIDYTKDTTWAPSERQRHPPVIARRKAKPMLSYTIDPVTRKVQRVIVVVRKEIPEMEMDRGKHTLIDTALENNVPVGFKTREEAIDNTLKTLEDKKEVINGDDTIKEDGVWHARSYIDEAIFDTKLKQKQHDNGDICTGYRSYSIVGIPFLGDKSRKGLIDKLSKKTKISEVASVMKMILNSSQEEANLKEFVVSLDAVLTKKLIASLRGKLSLGITMDNFTEDAVGLFQWLEDNYGLSYAEAYGRYQETFIKSFIKSPEPDMESDLIRALIPEGDIPEDLVPKPINNVGVTLLENLVSVTSIRASSNELNLLLYNNPQFPGIGSLIERHQLPALFDFTDRLFNEDRSLNNDIAHHLLVTLDDKIYELHKGIVSVSDNYLISEYVKS
jgi:hypothetical protein